MSYDVPVTAGSRWRDRASGWVTVLALAGMAVYAFFLRCLHLLNDDGHYYVIGADSYFFHWLAQRVMDGEPPPLNAPEFGVYTLRSGLAYPIAYLSRAIGADSVEFMSKFVPPFLAVVSLVLIYLAVSRICNRRVALLSAFSWAIMSHAFVIGGAGYVDRDSLSMLLVMAGAFLFYISYRWRLVVRGRDAGWLAAGLGVLLIEVMISLEWAFAGRVLLLALIAAYFLVRFLVGFSVRRVPQPDIKGRFSAAIKEVSWRAFAVIVAGNIVWESLILGGVLGVEPGFLSKFATMMGIIEAGGSGEFVSGARISEMMRMKPFDDIILGYHFFLIPIAAGLYVTWTRRDEGGIFFICWFAVLLILSLFARRILLYAVPAASMLSGLGLVYLWEVEVAPQQQQLKKAGVAILICLSLVLATSVAYHIGSAMAAPEEWQDAMAYLEDNTPEDAVVMSNWTYGYWILDLGNRRSVIDNGYYNYDLDRLRDVATVYFTSDTAEAVEIMEKYDAEYLIFTKDDVTSYASTILDWAEFDEEYDSFLPNSLVVRSIDGLLKPEEGLEVIYRSPTHSRIVILGLTTPGEAM